ncbi:MAG TPA: CAP domain-containing protein [Acidimicrobiia bacterium]
MVGKTRWLSILLTVALAIVGISASAAADSGTEQGFLSKINAERSSRGLGTLSVDGGLSSHARAHTAEMIAADDLYHSSSGELQAAAGSGWSAIAENVGRGGTVDSLHTAFMNSSGHRANILGDYNFVGIGTGTASDGRLYVTVVFMKKGSTSPPAPTTTAGSTNTTAGSTNTTTAEQKTTTTAAPTTTTTTLPPTTTTTLIVGPDKPVTPGESCFFATRDGWMCHD